MAHYYISDIIGDGVTPETAFRPRVADYIGCSMAAMPSNPDGSPAADWVLVRCAMDNINHASISKLPVLPPQASDAAINALNNILTARGISIDESSPEYIGAKRMIERDYN